MKNHPFGKLRASNGFASLYVIIAIVVIATGLGYFAFKNQTQNQTTVNNQTQASSTNETANWQTYQNNKYGYSIKFPNDWEIIKQNAKGMQITSKTIADRVKKGDTHDGYSAIDIKVVDVFKDYSSQAADGKEELLSASGEKITVFKNVPGFVRRDIAQVEGGDVLIEIDGGYSLDMLKKIASTLIFTKQPQSNEVTNWQTYTWGDLSFKYPPDWIIKEEFYNTPAGQAEGRAPGLIALRLTSKTNPKDAIGMGGRQFGCSHPTFPSDRKCLTVYMTPFYTVGTSTQSNEIFDKVVASARMKNRGVEMILPDPGDIWESDKDYVVKWKTIQPGLEKLSVYMTDTRIEGGDGLTFQKYGLPTNGEVKISIPKGKLTSGEERIFGPFIINVSGGITVPKESLPEGALGGSYVYEAWSAPIYIKSSTGNPDFPLIPKG